MASRSTGPLCVSASVPVIDTSRFLWRGGGMRCTECLLVTYARARMLRVPVQACASYRAVCHVRLCACVRAQQTEVQNDCAGDWAPNCSPVQAAALQAPGAARGVSAVCLARLCLVPNPM